MQEYKRWRTSKVIIVSIYNFIHENKHIISFTIFVRFTKNFERFSYGNWCFSHGNAELK